MPIMDAEKLYKIPGRALNASCRLQLSQFLNPTQLLCSTSGLPRDFRGLAEQMGFKSIDVQNFLQSENPTFKTLEKWEKQEDATFGQLLEFLKQMGRHDIVEEVYSSLEKDAQAFLNRGQEIPLQISRKNLQDVSNTSCQPPDFRVKHDFKALTCDDSRTGECTFYDAYLCYADENEDFAIELANRLESPQIGLKLYIEGRDSLGGLNECAASAKLIEERCRYMLVILSSEFDKSPALKFLSDFATSLSIERAKRITVPIVLSPCEAPLLKFTSKIDFTKPAIRDWAWQRLIKSLKDQPQKDGSFSISSNERQSCSNTVMTSIEAPCHNSSIPCIEFPPTPNSSIHLKPSAISSCSSLEISSDVIIDSESKNSKSSTFQQIWQNVIKSKKISSKKSPVLKEHSPLNSISSSNITSGFYSLGSRDLESVEESAKCSPIYT